MKNYGLKNPDGTTNNSRKDHVSAIIVSLLQAGAFFGALVSAPVSGKLTYAKKIIWAFELCSRHRCINSPSWAEEIFTRVLCHLLGRCCEWFDGRSIHFE